MEANVPYIVAMEVKTQPSPQSFQSAVLKAAGREANSFSNVQLRRHAGVFSTRLCDG